MADLAFIGDVFHYDVEKPCHICADSSEDIPEKDWDLTGPLHH